MIGNPKRVVFLLLVVILAACGKPGTPSHKSVGRTSATSMTTTTAPVSIVQVDFEGLIAHVVPETGNVTKRAVVIADDGIHLHNFFVTIPPINEAESELDIIGAYHPPCHAKAGCTIGAIKDGITFTIENLTAGLNKSTTFRTFVPSLSDAQGTGAIPDSSLHADLAKATPTAGGSFLAYFDYTGGLLTATPYCGLGNFKNTSSNRRFAYIVTLTGEAVTSAATLKVVNNNTGASKTFTFKNPDYIYLLFRNMPISGTVMTDHFPLYEKLFRSGTVKLPEVDNTLGCPPKGTVVGCSDSQWP